MLSQKAIDDFKKIYLEEFKEELSDEKARELGERLISLFKIIYRPIPEEDLAKYKHNQDSNS